MSHFSNQTQFLQWLQTKKFATYKLMDQSGSVLENESGIEPELVAPKIENCIDLLSPGIYKFEGKINTHNATTPFVASFFKVNSFSNLFSNSIDQNNSNISGASTNTDIEKMFEERLKIELEKRKKDDEIANLKAKVKELEQEIKENKPDKFEEAIGKIAQYFPNIMNNQMKNPNPNPNPNQNNSNISGSEEEEKIAVLLEKLMKNIELAGFDIEKTLVKLSNLNPDQLKMFIPMIP